jgi:hypothetical protein
MSPTDQTEPANSISAEHESDLAEYERQVQFSEFVPNPFRVFDGVMRSPSPFASPA